MQERSTLSRLLALAGWLALTFAAAAIGSVATSQSGDFYGQLARPSWAPPASVFGPVWSVLYLLMGIAAWLAWRERDAPGRAAALALFVVQLVANALWSWFFFAWRNGAAAFADVLVLLALVAAATVAFWRIRRLAGLLLVPYLAWVAFASALTWSIWRRNPGLL